MGEDQLHDLELDGPITLRILDIAIWDFMLAKWSGVMKDREVWWLHGTLMEKRAMKKEEK